jgi:hypothetical protein
MQILPSPASGRRGGDEGRRADEKMFTRTLSILKTSLNMHFANLNYPHPNPLPLAVEGAISLSRLVSIPMPFEIRPIVR